jgi:DNA-binding transcriptional ArsR family regulator
MVGVCDEWRVNRVKSPIYLDLIMRVLVHGRINLAALNIEVKKSESVLQRQLVVLLKEGFLTSETEGKKVFYKVNWEHLVKSFEKIVDEELKKKKEIEARIEDINSFLSLSKATMTEVYSVRDKK